MVQISFLMSLFFISCWFINSLSNNTINEKESVESALLLSVFITLSTLFFVSNVFIVIGLLMSFLLASTDKQSRRKALTAGLVMVFVRCLLTGGLFYSIWLLSVKPSSGVSFLTWITS